MTILYRMKNPHTNQYFCKSADLINEAPLEYSLVYTEETAQKIIHDANIMGKLLFDHLGYKEDFKGYILEEASLDSIQIPDDQTNGNLMWNESPGLTIFLFQKLRKYSAKN